ncbi:hypothetical protein PHYBOEH_012098 [Phytophthora boehmeriae]|uniref:PX domain-containing protein n=1 Tax=Phytophthora boehmeriae TaxID=109152 RepID=A0A8T1WWM8_9STRA|nr:hypothetical protein PHYBOEH_012098 [Phytophthora boehmeriae]
MQSRSAFRPTQRSGSHSQAAVIPSTGNRRILTLHEVDTILISNSRLLGTTYYTLDIYTSPSTSPSTSNAVHWRPSEDGEECTRQPQYQIERTTADFKRLRVALNNAAHLAHKFSYCDFCKEMILYLDTEDKRLESSMYRLLVGQDKVARSQEEFINDVLAMLAYPFTACGAPLCSGQVQSHQVLYQFLLPRARDS